METDCLEASVEVERFNRDSSGKTYFTKDLDKRRSSKRSSSAASAFSGGPIVERVAFSRDGKVEMILLSLVIVCYIFLALGRWILCVLLKKRRS